MLNGGRDNHSDGSAHSLEGRNIIKKSIVVINSKQKDFKKSNHFKDTSSMTNQNQLNRIQQNAQSPSQNQHNYQQNISPGTTV